MESPINLKHSKYANTLI